MAEILLRMPVEADADRIYSAVANEDGVQGWWSEKTTGPEGVGSTIKVSFPDAPITFDFEVTEANDHKRVAWHCLAGPPEWIGTEVSFDVETSPEGNSLLFTHGGWKTTAESFPFIAYSWAQILPRLKKLAEEGERDPFFRF
jgi:hypothetical protein